MTALNYRILTVVAALFICSGLVLGAQADPEPVRISQFSGKPVPRFESLRYTAVHGRQGPSLDHPILWRYEKEGLPMLIVRETNGWRRVRDKDGDEVWMQARMLSVDRKVVAIDETILYRKPGTDAVKRATLKPGVIADLELCDGMWCRVRIGRETGWIEKTSLWGVETATGGL